MIRRRIIILLTLAALGLLAAVGRAEEGPIVIARPQTHPFLTLNPFHGSVEFTGIYEMDKSRALNSTVSASDALLTQELTLGTGGTVVSQNLLNWTAEGSLELDENWSQTDNSSGSSVGVFDTYDISLNFLGGTQYPVTLWANRSETYINRAFAGILRNTITGYGANLQYRSPILPSTLNLSHTTTTQTDLFGVQQFTIDQSNADFNTSFQPADRQHVSVTASYGTVDQNNPGLVTNNSQRQSLSINHDWSIDPLAHYTLSSAFVYSNLNGTYNETRLRLDEQLRLRLAEDLDGAVNYTWDRQEYATSQLTMHRLNASLTHRLYESLTTTGRVGMTLTDNSFSGATSSSSTQDYFAAVTTSYNKKVFLGRFGANLSLGINQNNSGAIGTTQQVLGDIQTFNDPQPIILTRTGVNEESVAVFNAAGTRRYIEGTDYTTSTVNNTVQIHRTIGGNIADNDTVRLNYNIDPLPGYSSQSLAFGTGANYTFEEGWLTGLNLYIRYYQVDQTISPVSSGILPDNIRDTTFGAEYRIWKLTLRAEEELRSSTLAPYDSLRLTADYADQITDRLNMSINVTESFINTPLDHSKTNSTTIDGRLNYDIARNLRAILTVRWRNDSYSTAGNTVGLEEQAELRWTIRQTEMYLILRHATLDTADSNLDSTILQVGLSRSF